MEAKTCPRCKEPQAEGRPHQCAATPAASNESAIPTIRHQAPGAATPTSARTKPAAKAAPRSGESSVAGATKKTGDEPPTGINEMLQDPSKVVNQYVLTQMLGKGGMGQVWKAWDTKLSRWIALKFLTLSDETNIKRFEREAKLAARLRHPNIAAVYEVGQDKGRHFIAMEFVDGTSLGKAGLTIRQSIEVIAKVARALAEAHKDGVIHRDLKPDNLMVTKSGRPYVMDFGLAKSLEAESSLSVSGDIMGTPLFMSPEQAKGEGDKIDPRTDVYSLGATLYTLLTGEKPFTGKTSMEILVKVANQDPVPPRKIKPDIPQPVEAVVLKCMEKDRDRRYPSAVALAEDLERYLANLDVEARLPSVSTLILRRLKRNIWPAALGFVMLIALAVGVLSWASRPTPAPDTEWLRTFRNERRSLEYRSWNPGDAALPSRIRDFLGRAASSSPEDAREAADWFGKEVEIAENMLEFWLSRPRSEWMKLKDPGTRARDWSDAAAASLQGLSGDFAALSTRLAQLRHGALTLARWRGEFTLRVAVVPFGEVTSLKRQGRELDLKDRETPLVLPELDIDDYEIELGSGSLPPQTLAIPADRLRDGVTTTILGDLRKAGTIRLSP
jgi:serine/threonine protein kinase